MRSYFFGTNLAMRLAPTDCDCPGCRETRFYCKPWNGSRNEINSDASKLYYYRDKRPRSWSRSHRQPKSGPLSKCLSANLPGHQLRVNQGPNQSGSNAFQQRSALPSRLHLFSPSLTQFEIHETHWPTTADRRSNDALSVHYYSVYLLGTAVWPSDTIDWGEPIITAVQQSSSWALDATQWETEGK